MSNPIQKYTFYAEFKDGTTYTQSADDVSLYDPEKRSGYYDIVQLSQPVYKESNIEGERVVIAQGNPVTKFILSGEGHTYMVSLEDGHFEVDGIKFRMHEEILSDFRLIFFRQHTHSFNQGDGTELSHDIVYRMGWQTEKDGENCQRIMQID